MKNRVNAFMSTSYIRAQRLLAAARANAGEILNQTLVAVNREVTNSIRRVMTAITPNTTNARMYVGASGTKREAIPPQKNPVIPATIPRVRLFIADSPNRSHLSTFPKADRNVCPTTIFYQIGSTPVLSPNDLVGQSRR